MLSWRDRSGYGYGLRRIWIGFIDSEVHRIRVNITILWVACSSLGKKLQPS